MNNDEKIVKEMIDSLVDTNIELWEINFDLLSNFEILKDIPVLRVGYNLCNFGKGIHDFIFIRKLQKFFINLPNVTEEEKEAFFERYKKDEIKFAEKLFEIIDNIDNSDKCEYEGKIFEKYFYNKISYEEFKMFSYALSKIGMDNIKKCYQIKIDEFQSLKILYYFLTQNVLVFDLQISKSTENSTFLFFNSKHIKADKTLIYQYFVGFSWRRHPDLNRGSEFCRLVPYHLAMAP